LLTHEFSILLLHWKSIVFFCEQVLGSLLSSIERRFGAFNALSAHTLDMAEISNQKFPFVRIPRFAVHAAKTLQSTNAVITFFNPVVKKEDRAQWERYASSDNNNIMTYINETTGFMRNFKDFYGPMPEDYNWTFKDSIYTDAGVYPENTTRTFFMPTWHIFPLVMRFYTPANFGTCAKNFYQKQNRTDESHILSCCAFYDVQIF
jgi:hypothetical protein